MPGASAHAADRRGNSVGALTHEVWRTCGGEVTSAEIYDMLGRWDAYRGLMGRFMADFPRHREPGLPHAVQSHRGRRGWVVRCGTSPEGLPIGVQFAARPWQDHVALAAGRHLESRLAPARRRPVSLSTAGSAPGRRNSFEPDVEKPATAPTRDQTRRDRAPSEPRS
jgi:amidase